MSYEEKTIILPKIEESCDNISINSLNDDCLILIFQRLPIIDKIKIERVCKRWQRLSKKSWYSFKKLNLQSLTWGWSADKCQDKIFICNKIMHNVLMRCGNYLTEVDLSRQNFHLILYGVSMGDICKQCRNLKVLNISDISTARQSFSTSFSVRTNLTSCLLLLNCESIVKLGFEPWLNEFEESNLMELFNRMKNLKVLRLGAFGRSLRIRGECLLYLPSDVIEEIILVNCRSIQSNLFHKAFDALTNLHTLALFECHFSIEVTEYDVKILSNLKKLKRLHYVGNFLTINILREICRNCKLTFLNLSGCQCLNNGQELSDSLEMLSNLEYLAISHGGLNDLHLKKINSLNCLELDTCHNLNTDSLCELIEHNLNLEFLKCTSCTCLNEEILKVAERITKTRENNITLNMCFYKTGIQDETLEKFPSSSFLKIFKNISHGKGKNSFNDFFFPDQRNFQFLEYDVANH